MNLITRSELAHLAGVSQAAITKACRRSLASAVSGQRVDLDAECVQKYVAKTDRAPTREARSYVSNEQIEIYADTVVRVLACLVARLARGPLKGPRTTPKPSTLDPLQGV